MELVFNTPLIILLVATGALVLCALQLFASHRAASRTILAAANRENAELTKLKEEFMLLQKITKGMGLKIQSLEQENRVNLQKMTELAQQAKAATLVPKAPIISVNTQLFDNPEQTLKSRIEQKVAH